MDELIETDESLDEILEDDENPEDEDLYVLEEEILQSYTEEIDLDRHRMDEAWEEESHQYNIEPETRVV